MNLLRPHFPQGDWEAKLRDLKIDKSLASRARRIARRFANEAQLAGLTVREALGPPQPKPSKHEPAKRRRAPATSPDGFELADFLEYVNINAAMLVEQARRVESINASVLIFVTSNAITNLVKIRDRLAEQAQAAPAGVTAAQPRAGTPATTGGEVNPRRAAQAGHKAQPHGDRQAQQGPLAVRVAAAASRWQTSTRGLTMRERPTATQ